MLAPQWSSPTVNKLQIDLMDNLRTKILDSGFDSRIILCVEVCAVSASTNEALKSSADFRGASHRARGVERWKITTTTTTTTTNNNNNHNNKHNNNNENVEMNKYMRICSL